MLMPRCGAELSGVQAAAVSQAKFAGSNFPLSRPVRLLSDAAPTVIGGLRLNNLAPSMSGRIEPIREKDVVSRGCLPSKETPMSVKLISVVAAFGVLSSVAIALDVTPSYPTKADFDWTFAQFGTVSTVDAESIAADRKKILMAGLKQMNLEKFGEE
jgi:hypothetical protein